MENNFNIWHDAATTRPEQSGLVVVITMGGYISSLQYNKEVDLFNVTDPNDTENAIDVMVWADYNEFCAEVSRQVNFDVIKRSDQYYHDLWGADDD